MKRCAAAFLVLLAISVGKNLIGQETRISSGSSQHVSAEDLVMRPVGENWPSYNGDYTGSRFSSLQEIDRTNVPRLRPTWVFHPGLTQKLEATPVVIRGVMYVTAS